MFSSLRVGQCIGLAAVLFVFLVIYLMWLLMAEHNIAISFAEE